MRRSTLSTSTPNSDLKSYIQAARKAPKKNTTDIHFLHIGKCAGSQIALIAKQINRRPKGRKIIKHNHDVFLRDLNTEADYFFSIRHPLTRFSSGFYSRKRKGAPRLNVPWTDHDEIAFQTFEHANDLAESLFEPGPLGRQAWAAMKSIRHTAQNQSDWFYCRGNFLQVRPPIWILRQEHFDADLGRFIDRAKLDHGDKAIQVSKNPTKAHRNDYSDVPALSDKALEKLRMWYAQDIAFYDMCEDWMIQTQKTGS